MRKHLKPAIFVILFSLFLFNVIYAQDAPSEPFKVAVSASPAAIPPGGSGTIRITFSIASGHYLYADQITVTPGMVQGLTFGEMKLPTPIKKEDPYIGTVFYFEKEVVIQVPVTADKSAALGKKAIPLAIGYQGCNESVCFTPRKEQVEVDLLIGDMAVAESPVERPTGFSKPRRSDNTHAAEIQDIAPPSSEQNPFQKTADKFGIFGVLLAAFIWGFLASLTPCVYPMIPVTVSVIGSGSTGSTWRGFVLSVFYVLGLSLTYAIFGTIAAWSGSIFGEYANHPAVRVIVTGIFVVLALGMFDVFYIQMPSAVSSRLGGKTKTGVIGVFLTGAAAGAVVGPCVGPMLVGLLVYIAAIGSKIQGFLIMWSFALGMGMLFLIIGTFSGAAASLPRSGMWMEKIKNFFGVLMLAIALYYVSPLIPENVLILIIGGFLIGIGVFMGALDGFGTEATGKDKLWKTIAIICLVAGIAYVAKFAFDDKCVGTEAVSPASGISWMSSEASALALAKTEKKPVMIDFSAQWCAACKRLEQKTFSHPSVIEASERFVCVKIDCTDSDNPMVRQLQQKYKVVGLPTIIFINSGGQVLSDRAITEFVNAEVFLRRMGEV